MTARDLLLEIGVEELPRSFLESALASIHQEADKLFADGQRDGQDDTDEEGDAG
jgi:glycyl-tRNA synthetase beta subunit